MTTIFGSLNTALRALQTMQRAVQTTSHNISNASTPGYSRQRVLFSTNDPYTAPTVLRDVSAGQVGTGVQASAIRRYRSGFLDSQIRNEMWTTKSWDVRLDTLRQIEVALNEPSETALNSQMSTFWASWQNLAATPDSAAARARVAETAGEIAASFRDTHRQLTDLQTDLDHRITGQVDTINGLAYRIAELNQKITYVDAVGQQPNDLRDERDKLLTDLSAMINVRVFETDNCAVTVSLGGKLLVMDHVVSELAAVPDDTNQLQNKVVWANTGKTVIVGQVRLEGGLSALAPERLGGKLGGALVARDLVIADKMTMLDEMANTLIGAVNGLHQTGYGLNNATGGAMTASPVPGTVDGFSLVVPWAGQTGLAAGDFAVEIRDNNNVLEFRLVDAAGNPVAINDATTPDPDQTVTAGWQALSLVQGTTFDTGRGVAVDFGTATDHAVLTPNTNSNVTGFSTGGVLSNLTELTSGRYYVEVNGGNQFRVVMDDGAGGTLPVDVLDAAAGNGSTTTGWQNITPSSTFDTGRGIAFTFGAGPAFTATYLNDGGATPQPANIRYDARNVQVGSLNNGAATVAFGNFFSGFGAGSIALSDYISADFNRIATAAGPDSPGDGSVALQMYQLSQATLMNGGTATIQDYYRAEIGSLGQETRHADIMSENHSLLIDHLTTRQEEISGVSIDEESVYLVEYQRTYQAAARVMTTVDEMLEKVINGMGLVGR